MQFLLTINYVIFENDAANRAAPNRSSGLLRLLLYSSVQQISHRCNTSEAKSHAPNNLNSALFGAACTTQTVAGKACQLKTSCQLITYIAVGNSEVEATINARSIADEFES